MTTFYLHKVGHSELLHSMLILWLADGYIACITTGNASWQKSIEPSDSRRDFVRHQSIRADEAPNIDEAFDTSNYFTLYH